jgi:hypothetical protein
MKKIKILKGIGIQDSLLNKLDDRTINMLSTYVKSSALDAENLLRLVVAVISLELQGKAGAIYLFTEGIATLSQLKNFSIQAIDDISMEYETNHDITLAKKHAKQVMLQQQEDNMMNRNDYVELHSNKRHQDDYY